MFDQIYLREVFDYEPDTGLLLWRRDRIKVKSGQRVGWFDKKDGYRYAYLDAITRKEHRFIWAYVTGEWPREIDHANGVRSDNRWSNLRVATRSQNRANSRLPKNNTSGHKGVYWSVSCGKWVAMLGVNKKRKTLGRFSVLEDAVRTYEEAAKRAFGRFYREA